ELMRAGTATLLASLRGEPLPGGHVVHPVAPGLDRRVWQGVFTPERAREAAAMGTHLLLPKAVGGDGGQAMQEQARATLAFREAWPWPWPGQVALSRPVYVSTSAEAARRELADEIGFQVEQANRARARTGNVARNLSREEFLDSRAFHMGSV